LSVGLSVGLSVCLTISLAIGSIALTGLGVSTLGVCLRRERGCRCAYISLIRYPLKMQSGKLTSLAHLLRDLLRLGGELVLTVLTLSGGGAILALSLLLTLSLALLTLGLTLLTLSLALLTLSLALLTLGLTSLTLCLAELTVLALLALRAVGRTGAVLTLSLLLLTLAPLTLLLLTLGLTLSLTLSLTLGLTLNLAILALSSTGLPICLTSLSVRLTILTVCLTSLGGKRLRDLALGVDLAILYGRIGAKLGKHAAISCDGVADSSHGVDVTGAGLAVVALGADVRVLTILTICLSIRLTGLTVAQLTILSIRLASLTIA
jgi:hypothetical protein